jgi:hypothetical protein
MHLRPLCLGTLAALVGLATSSCHTARPAPRQVAILCHYMTWFKWRSEEGLPAQAHWGWNGPGPTHDPNQVGPTGLRDLCSVAYPRIGLYDSSDPDVLDYHILTAKAAGIQGFVVDWYGPGNDVDAALQVLFARAAELDFKVAICLEEKLCFPGWQAPIADRAAARDAAVALLADIMARYAPHPAYWRHHGRPAVFIFNAWGDWPGQGRKTFDGAEWLEIASRAQATELALVPQHFGLGPGHVRAAYGWCGDAQHLEYVVREGNARLADGSFDFYVAPACPGFDDRGVWGWGGGPRLDARLGTEAYADYWRVVQRSRADAVQLVTWNDFAEGTVIEPTVEWGHLYMDETERQVATLTGRPADLADNPLAYHWFVARKLAAADRQPRLAEVRTWLAKGQADRAAAALRQLHPELPPYLDARREPPRYTVLTQAGRDRAALLASFDRALVQPATAVASSQEDDRHAAPLACDGDATTRWASAASDEQWLLLTWPQPVTARQLGLAWEAAYATRYEVEVSADGQTWQSVAQVTNGTGGSVRHDLPAQPFRQLRLRCHQRATQWGYSIHELGLIP